MEKGQNGYRLSYDRKTEGVIIDFGFPKEDNAMVNNLSFGIEL